MICPKCKELNLKSIVTPSPGTSTTLAYYAPYYDEDGKYHHHDGNSCSQGFTCSNGHRATIVMENKCPNCDWIKEGFTTVYEQEPISK